MALYALVVAEAENAAVEMVLRDLLLGDVRVRIVNFHFGGETVDQRARLGLAETEAGHANFQPRAYLLRLEQKLVHVLSLQPGAHAFERRRRHVLAVEEDG